MQTRRCWSVMYNVSHVGGRMRRINSFLFAISKRHIIWGRPTSVIYDRIEGILRTKKHWEDAFGDMNYESVLNFLSDTRMHPIFLLKMEREGENVNRRRRQSHNCFLYKTPISARSYDRLIELVISLKVFVIKFGSRFAWVRSSKVEI